MTGDGADVRLGDLTGDDSGDALFENLDMADDLTELFDWARSDLAEMFDWARSDLTEMFDWARSNVTGDDILEIVDMAEENAAVEVLARAVTELSDCTVEWMRGKSTVTMRECTNEAWGVCMCK